MKKLTIILIAALALLTAGNIHAQTSTNSTPLNEQTFLQTFQGYFLSFNTNLASTFATDTIDIWTGMEYVNNQNTAASLGISYNAFKLSAVNIGLESVTRNAGINGVSS